MAFTRSEIRQEYRNQVSKRLRLTTNSKSDKGFNLSDSKRLGNVIRIRKAVKRG